ncbi:sulfate reduction electron transfer complex DsrMKJOP subunit DsrP [Desulfolutivibrio sulfoxidireducens]|uniref:sulfate reduction electron transfer complex DsrMKJOP subunit DsrP n=1 Tax=Desulfolutivibrio sulfoxidireducens TaxID=2773299 RepID=UPI00159E632D|nr:NrfD/PsrC family molybdoenzyme membrane anchor subunit [Desulfolutivibrio sulfoxidireducens]QLA17758.1 menaquinol oxidoreductase [Desulfolutivibrio sulfoxidireducens]QLA21333.1 menaquinol oxidoreductase [Desulfolutivibrio sulfoxidireducens]
MLEKALKGSPRYWGLIVGLLCVIGLGAGFWMYQLTKGLVITDLSRDVSWGFYIAQLTYFVGVAASAVMLVLPYYFHHFKDFSKMIILGEFLAISSVLMCMLFVVVDLGQPQRMLNIIFHPTPNSVLFWDMIVLNGYLFLNAIIGWVTLQAFRNDMAPPAWVKPLIYLSVIWAFSIHTVTAFLYAGLPGRHYWLTAIMAARFLASAFCSGPAILLLLTLLVRRLTTFDPGKKAIDTLATIITYAMCVNVFFFLLELFTAFYSNMPGHMAPIVYLFKGFDGDTTLVPFMWTAAVLAIISLAMLIPYQIRQKRPALITALIFLVIASWIDKGMGLIVAGFAPNPFEKVTSYLPTVPELMVASMVFAIGALVLTVLWKVALGVRSEVEGGNLSMVAQKSE